MTELTLHPIHRTPRHAEAGIVVVPVLGSPVPLFRSFAFTLAPASYRDVCELVTSGGIRIQHG